MPIYPRNLEKTLLRWSCLLPLVAIAEPAVIESRPPPVRDHVLFVGASLAVREGDALVAVRRVEGRQVELESGARLNLRQTTGLQLRPVTKVGNTELKVADLTVERCYSPAADPHREQMRRQVEMQEYVEGRAAAAETALRQSTLPLNPGETRSPDELKAQAELNQTGDPVTGFTGAQQGGSALWLEATRSGATPGHARQAPDFDAVRLQCELSAPVSVREVQAVVVMRMVKEGEVGDLSFTAGVGDIGPVPRQIELLRPGIPPGYVVKAARLHLFARTEELPTNLAEKRYALTAEEAHEYLRLTHLDRHRGETVPAAPVWSLVPPTLLDREDGRELDFPVQVDLDATGRVVRLHDGAVPLPAPVRAVFEDMVFVPALQDGVAVASTLTVNPADFFR